MVMVGYYFERRRALATGIACSGAGFGMLVLAPVSAWLLDHYDWKNAMFILSGIVMQSIVLGALMRPLQLHSEDTVTDLCLTRDEEKALLDQSHTYDTDIPLYDTETVDDIDIQIHSSSGQDTQLPLPKGNICSVPYANSTGNVSLDDNEFIENAREQVIITENKDNGTQLYEKAIQNLMDQYPCNSSDNGGMPIKTQSCYELPTVSPLTAKKYENKGHKGVTQGPCYALSCHDLSSQSRPHHPLLDKKYVKGELLKPLNRRDIFFGASLQTLAEYRSQPDMTSYIASVTVIPKPTEDDTTCCSCVPADIRRILSEMLDFSVMSNPHFVIICIGSIFIQIGYFIPIVFITAYATSLGINTRKAASLISVMGKSTVRPLVSMIGNLYL